MFSYNVLKMTLMSFTVFMNCKKGMWIIMKKDINIINIVFRGDFSRFESFKIKLCTSYTHDCGYDYDF